MKTNTVPIAERIDRLITRWKSENRLPDDTNAGRGTIKVTIKPEAQPTLGEVFRTIARRLHSAALSGDWNEIARIRLLCDEEGYACEQEEHETLDSPSASPAPKIKRKRCAKRKTFAKALKNKACGTERKL